MTRSKNWNVPENTPVPEIKDQLLDLQAESVRVAMDQQILDALNNRLFSQATIPSTYKNNYSIRSDNVWTTRARTPLVTLNDKEVRVDTPDGITESISREDLIKYIDERKLVQENEVVRKMYERYQVAVKLARSDNNGDTGE